MVYAFSFWCARHGKYMVLAGFRVILLECLCFGDFHMIHVNRTVLRNSEGSFLRIEGAPLYDHKFRIDEEAEGSVESWQWCWNDSTKSVYCVQCAGMEILFPDTRPRFVQLHRFVAYVVSRKRGETRRIGRVSVPNPFDYRLSALFVSYLNSSEIDLSMTEPSAIAEALIRRGDIGKVLDELVRRGGR